MKIFLEVLYKLISLAIVVAIVYFNAYQGTGNPFVYLGALVILGTLIISEGYLVLLWVLARKTPIDEHVVKLLLAITHHDKELAQEVLAYYHNEKELNVRR